MHAEGRNAIPHPASGSCRSLGTALKLPMDRISYIGKSFNTFCAKILGETYSSYSTTLMSPSMSRMRTPTRSLRAVGTFLPT